MTMNNHGSRITNKTDINGGHIEVNSRRVIISSDHCDWLFTTCALLWSQWWSLTKKFGVAAIKKTCEKNGKKYKEVLPKYLTPIDQENPKPTMASNNEAEVYTSIEQAYRCLTPELAKHD
ncbi:hypothetical protein MtrunA17_Chr4g0019221 [Medicago truncatula]|uniref:Uncharacterized protein n=1 Tax=Medicago truncatula TaxID=3880 RepID=A0A396I2T6_MEDTR|nr:hypothetical protein MtrunA17_Chr4g0019221 [Medicago truncatula]